MDIAEERVVWLEGIELFVTEWIEELKDHSAAINWLTETQFQQHTYTYADAFPGSRSRSLLARAASRQELVDI